MNIGAGPQCLLLRSRGAVGYYYRLGAFFRPHCERILHALKLVEFTFSLKIGPEHSSRQYQLFAWTVGAAEELYGEDQNSG